MIIFSWVLVGAIFLTFFYVVYSIRRRRSYDGCSEREEQTRRPDIEAIKKQWEKRYIPSDKGALLAGTSSMLTTGLNLIDYIENLEVTIYDLAELINTIETADDLCYEQDPPTPKRVLELTEWHKVLSIIQALEQATVSS